MWDKFYEQFVTFGGYQNVLLGLCNTLVIAIAGLAIGIVIGTLIAVLHVAGTRSKVVRVFSAIGDVYTTIFRGTPIIVQLLIFHYIIFASVRIDGLLEAVIVFGLNSGAYVSEIMRGGIQSVDVGQLEAGRTLGLSFSITMLKVVFPQAIKNVVPTLGNELDRAHKGYVRRGLCRNGRSHARLSGDRKRELRVYHPLSDARARVPYHRHHLYRYHPCCGKEAA